MEINKELEENKIKKKICPKCNDKLKDFTKAREENGQQYTQHWVECVNYYCRWEKLIDEI